MHDPSLFSGEGDDGTFVPFTDILFNALLGFAVMLFIAFSLVRPEAKTGIVDTKAEMIVTVTWPDNNEDDIDTYVQEPGGDVVWYHSMQKGLVTLDRDDRGNYLDEITVNGKLIRVPLNQETVTVRGVIPGEYVVNVYHYLNPSGAPVPVTVKVEKINPTLSVVYYDTVTLRKMGDERTAVRFTLDDEGNVSDINTRQVSLVQAVRK
ncbi:hypothetical protein [Devosia sp.]|jgi:hypothetical protein|uniref:hypothetical protein n=1 Tax=Devosia sp. TaxID=1871048 RepID=UPI001AD30B3E|nr:hypothetical protein [Devosia sp.]MBN9332616.1 hypothetical protein [Devosia sp.]